MCWHHFVAETCLYFGPRDATRIESWGPIDVVTIFVFKFMWWFAFGHADVGTALANQLWIIAIWEHNFGLGHMQLQEGKVSNGRILAMSGYKRSEITSKNVCLPLAHRCLVVKMTLCCQLTKKKLPQVEIQNLGYPAIASPWIARFPDILQQPICQTKVLDPSFFFFICPKPVGPMWGQTVYKVTFVRN